MIAISTLGFIAFLIVGLVLLCGGAVSMLAGAMHPNGDGGWYSSGGCLGALIGFAAFICAIVGLFGGFA